jgi:hypothetical protein
LTTQLAIRSYVTGGHQWRSPFSAQRATTMKIVKEIAVIIGSVFFGIFLGSIIWFATFLIQRALGG